MVPDFLNKKRIADSNSVANPFGRFSFNLLSHLFLSNPKENFLVSPTRIMSILAFISNFTSEKSKQQILKLLGIENYNDKEILDLFLPDVILPKGEEDCPWRDEDSIKLLMQISSSAWIDSMVRPSKKFEDVSNDWKFVIFKTSFAADLIEKVKQEMSDYIKHSTNGLLEKVDVPIDSLTRVVLIDCIYFKGGWKEPFDSYDTSPDKFFSVNGIRKVDFMEKWDKYAKYYRCSVFESIELDYDLYSEERCYSMRIYLPKKEKSLKDVFEEIWEKKAPIEYKEKPVVLKLPKFSFSKTESLLEVIRKQGLDVDSLKINFSEDKNDVLKIDKIAQQGTIKVSEKGTEAGVATLMICAAGPPTRVRYTHMTVNRPFIFEIVETYSGSRLFSGIVNDID